MHKFTVGLLILIAGWALGWYSHTHWDTDQAPPALPVIPALSNPVNPEEPTIDFTQTAPAHIDSMASLLQHNEFSAVIEHYDSLQAQAGDVEVADARAQILSHARQLIAASHFSLAEQLLQLFLVASYRDVETRILLADAFHGQDDLNTAIDQLYEAKGYAYRPAMLEQTSRRIRTIVAELTQSLKRNNDQYALLLLYQHLTQQEPDHAPWFIGLATAQMALHDTEAAQRSLSLVSQDLDVGAQAQAMLSKMNVALAKMQDTQSLVSATEVIGIPLHRSGNHFMVDAKPGQGQDIRLLIDTGASLTIITPYALEQGGIRYDKTGRTGVFTTANGPVRAPIYKLDSLWIGGWHVSQLEIGVLDLAGNPGLDGLLGMNFLKHFQFFIDQNEALLRLSVN